jgi:hypothetical protein
MVRLRKVVLPAMEREKQRARRSRVDRSVRP